eukprot:UN27120
MKQVHPVFRRFVEILEEVYQPQINGSFNRTPTFWKNIFRFPEYTKFILNKKMTEIKKNVSEENNNVWNPPFNGLIRCATSVGKKKMFSEELDPKFKKYMNCWNLILKLYPTKIENRKKQKQRLPKLLEQTKHKTRRGLTCYLRQNRLNYITICRNPIWHC